MKTSKSKSWLKLQTSIAQSVTIFGKYIMGMLFFP